VLTDAAFLRRNPDRRDDKPCVYVGSTYLSPEERFQQHLAGVHKNRYAFRYGVRLRPRLYRGHQDYATRPEAEAAEKRLAERLRKRGYGVWQGQRLGGADLYGSAISRSRQIFLASRSLTSR
jgi:hypothetical protein